MIPPNPFQSSSSSSSSATNMPGSFLPAIPSSLPIYPKHHSHFHYTPQSQPQSAQSPSPTLAPTRKRSQQRRPADTPPSNYCNNNYDSDEDVMRNSLYSDTAFRTSLAGSRKRGLADDDVDDGPSGKRVEVAGEDGRPAAKRRIIDVVGSVASRVWEFCISKTPFYSGVEGTGQGEEDVEFEREIQRHMKAMPRGYSNTQFQGQGSGEAGSGMGMQQNYFAPSTPTYSPPKVVQPQSKQDRSTGGLSSRWVMVSPTPAAASTASARPSTAKYTPSNSASRIPRPYTAPSIYTTPPYSPTTYATTATSTTTAIATVTPTNNSQSSRNSTASSTSASRRPAVRPVVAASNRAKRPTMVRGRHSHASSTSSTSGGFSGICAAPPQSTFTFGGAGSSLARGGVASSASTRSRRKLTGGIAGGRAVSAGSIGGAGNFNGVGRDEDEDEADESIRRFNEKLKDMIREGREALGSRIEVTYDDDEDLEGF